MTPEHFDYQPRAALDSQAVESMETDLRSILAILDGQLEEKGRETES